MIKSDLQLVFNSIRSAIKISTRIINHVMDNMLIRLRTSINIQFNYCNRPKNILVIGLRKGINTHIMIFIYIHEISFQEKRRNKIIVKKDSHALLPNLWEEI